MSLLCKIFGHKWELDESMGITEDQIQYSKLKSIDLICARCEAETFATKDEDDS